jgi:leucyl-tRNA synthetase
MIVQVNGKVRAKLEVAPGIDEDQATRRALEAVDLGGTALQRVIVKPPKLVNLVL